MILNLYDSFFFHLSCHASLDQNQNFVHLMINIHVAFLVLKSKLFSQLKIGVCSLHIGSASRDGATRKEASHVKFATRYYALPILNVPFQIQILGTVI